MNEQKPPNAIEWTRIRRPDGTYTKGFTWNVLGGCKHACQWEMPNGEVAECYAKVVAERVAQASYPHGFEHHYWHPSRLKEPLKVKEPAGIFLDSMSDLMGHWVEDEQIEQVLDICRQAEWHTFFLLTKNAPRLLKFSFPSNVWVGVSSPPDWMWNKRLTRDQQHRMLDKTLDVLSKVDAQIRWISAEPLSWDCSALFAKHPNAVQWVVIGAASNGRTEYPPAAEDVTALLEVLDKQHIPVFYKGNMRTLPMTAADWRHEFPDSLYAPHQFTQPVNMDTGESKPQPYAGYLTEATDYDMPWPDYSPPGESPGKQHSIEVFTSRISSHDPDALDITVKSASTPEGQALAPLWPMVMEHKSGALTDAGYQERYLHLLRERYRQDKTPFLSILRRDRVVLTCYCAGDGFCHRHLAVNVLEQIASHNGIQFIRAGELTVTPTPAPDAPKQLALL